MLQKMKNNKFKNVDCSIRKIALIRLIRIIRIRLKAINREFYKRYYRKKYNDKMSIDNKIHMLAILMGKKVLEEKLDLYKTLLKNPIC